MNIKTSLFLVATSIKRGNKGTLSMTILNIDSPIVKYDYHKDGYDIKSGRWVLKSINPEDEKKVANIYKSMVDGYFLNKNDRDQIIIGKEIAGRYGGDLDYLSLGVSVGDEVDVLFSNGINRTYTIKGSRT